MMCYSLSHLADDTLLQGLATVLKQDRTTTAALLAHLAEVDERRLYARSAHPSMYLYCVQKLHMSEDMAFMRIRAARTARQFPSIYPALADGRLHLTAVVRLTPYLTPKTASELLAAAEHKTKAEIELLLAERFPQRDLPTLVQAMAPAVATDALAARPVEVAGPVCQLVPEPVASIVEPPALQLAPEPVAAMVRAKTPVSMAPIPSRATLAPLSPGRFALQVTVSQTTHDKLRYAQALLGHTLPSGDVEAVLELALDALVEKLEREKFAKSARSRPRHGAAKGRYVPADVRRTVWQRDGGRCTFVSESGKRCGSTTRLEFDHVDPVARGGETTAARMRLRCRAHNQYEAECVFGAGFMRGKRQEARDRTAQRQARAQAQERANCVRKAAPVASGPA
jgi:hypothetical protein